MIAILKRELVAFFKNPIAYFVIAIYAFLSALFFTLFVLYANTSYVGNYFGFYLILVDIIVISVMSMRFFSEEKKNKTDQLILTSPVSLYGVVFGKFLGGLVLFLAATCINFVYLLIIDIYGNLDYGTVASNLIGTFFIGCAMISVGILVSALTENAIGAAAGTFGVFALMLVADFFSVLMPSFLRVPMQMLNIYNQYNDFTDGLVSLVPIVYYLSVTAICLFLAVRVLERRRWQ